MDIQNCHTLLFDMDGVLIDSRQAVESFWRGIAEPYHITLSTEDIESHIIGCKADLTIDRLFAFLDSSARDDVMAQLKISELNQTYTEVPGAVELIRKVKEHGYQLGLVTSAESFKVREVIRQLNLEGIFDQIVSSRDVLQGKPAPDCYLLAARCFQQDSRYCIVFEDSISGVQSAVRAGAICIGINHDRDLLLKHGAAMVYPDFKDSKLLELLIGNSL